MEEFAPVMVNGRGQVSHGDTSQLIVIFYLEAEHQGMESELAGRPIFKDRAYIWIRFPGDKTRDIKRRAKDMDKVQFPRQWAAFENQAQDMHEGTPIEQWAPITKSMALNLKGVNVHTVEQLASVQDSVLHNLGHGGRTLRDQAIAWLASAENSAETLKLKQENSRMADDIAMLKEQIAELGKSKSKK